MADNSRDKRKDDLFSFVLSLIIVGLSFYPMYRDKLDRGRMWVENQFRPRPEVEPTREMLRDLYDDLR